jgi:hypothetical protein
MKVVNYFIIMGDSSVRWKTGRLFCGGHRSAPFFKLSVTAWLDSSSAVSTGVTATDDYKVEEDEVGGTCGTNGGEEERV